MPYIIRPPRKLKLLAGVAATLAAFAITPALASASCPSTESSPVFSKLGDMANYTLLQGSSFEAGAPGWTLRNASIVNGNQNVGVGAGGTHSLQLAPGGEAVSPAFCVSNENPFFRFFVHRTSGTWMGLTAVIRWTDAYGYAHETVSASEQTGTSWTPTSPLQLATSLPLWQSGATLQVQLVFRTEAFGGAAAIDDVYIDPYRK